MLAGNSETRRGHFEVAYVIGWHGRNGKDATRPRMVSWLPERWPPAHPSHRAELDERDYLAARAAAAHEQEARRLAEQLDQSRTAVSAAQVRADAADHRAARAEEAARKATERAAEAEASLSRIQVEMAREQSAIESANQRTAAAERLLEQARADLNAERDRHDSSLSQLHEQLAQLIARTPTRRPTANSASAKKRSAPSS